MEEFICTTQKHFKFFHIRLVFPVWLSLVIQKATVNCLFDLVMSQKYPGALIQKLRLTVWPFPHNSLQPSFVTPRALRELSQQRATKYQNGDNGSH